jgi:Alpha-L-arabinofuranosidase B (ABFB) domain
MRLRGHDSSLLTTLGALLAGAGCASPPSEGQASSSGEVAPPLEPPSSAEPMPPSEGASFGEVCLEALNRLRATVPLPPYARDAENEACAQAQVRRDAEGLEAARDARPCEEVARLECPSWAGTPENVVRACIGQTWERGAAGQEIERVGYQLMSSSQYTRVACAYHESARRGLWVVLDYYLDVDPTATRWLQSYNHPDHYLSIPDDEQGDDQGRIARPTTDEERARAALRLVPGLATGECFSFESVAQPGHYLRHDDIYVVLQRLEDESGYEEDATYCPRPGNADASWLSFESLNRPGTFLRHAGYELYLSAPGDGPFDADSTFRIVDPG